MATVEELEMRLQAAEATIDQLKGTPLPQGAQVSFPVTGYQANMPEWMGMFQALANGVLDHGGNPFSMTVSDVDDSITVNVETNTGVNEALVRGLGYRQSVPVKLYAPAVSSTTTYRVGIEYDPAKETDPTEAVRLVCIPTGTWNAVSGKVRFKLVTFTRNPSQLLSDAWSTAQFHRMRLSPTVYAASVGALPTRAEGALWGQSAIVGPANGPWDRYLCVGNAAGQDWVNISAPDWQDMWIHPARVYPGFGWRPRFRRFSDRVEYRGVFRRSDNSAFRAGESLTLGTATGGVTFPETTRWAGGTGLGGGEILVEPNGDVRVTPGRDVWTVAIDGLVAWTK